MKKGHFVMLVLVIGAASASSAQARDVFNIGVQVGGYGYAPPTVYDAAPSVVYVAPPVRYYVEPMRNDYYAPRAYYSAPGLSFNYSNGGHTLHREGGDYYRNHGGRTLHQQGGDYYKGHHGHGEHSHGGRGHR